MNQFQAAEKINPRLCAFGRIDSRLFSHRRVDFVEQIKVLVPAEDVADVRHVFLPSAYQRALFLARLAHRRQHDGTHFQRRLLHLRQRDLGLEGAHLPGLVFAHDKFQAVLSRRQIEAGGVLNVFLPRLQSRIEIELDRLARLADGPLGLVDDRADDVQRGLVRFSTLGVAALHKRNLRAGNDQRNRHKETVIVEAEIQSVQIDGHVGGRQVAG